MNTPFDPVNPARVLLSLDGHVYPLEYRWLRLNGFSGLSPWRCIDHLDEATTIRKEFLLEIGRGSIPVRDLLPFARINQGDNIAGFIQADGKVTGEVCVAHLTFRSSAEVSAYPKHQIHSSIWEWLTMVLDTTRAHCTPQAVAELESSLTQQASNH